MMGRGHIVVQPEARNDKNIGKGEASMLAGTAFNREDPISEVTLGVSF